MVMRLLNKSEIATAKAQDRQIAITEGLKLATKVDNLREVSANEEATLSRYRVETLAEIQAEIAEKASARDELDAEVRVLENRKASALAPLTRHEEELKAYAEELAQKEASLGTYDANLALKNADLIKRENNVAGREHNAEVVHTSATRFMEEASTIRVNADEHMRNATEMLRKAELEVGVKHANAAQREEWVTVRETKASEREEATRKETIELAKGWALLKDREQTLERELKRQGK